MPGSQLLVLSSPYAVPSALDKLIADGRYMDAYLNLQSTNRHAGQFFVMELLANGLSSDTGRDQPFDSTARDGNTPVGFDGNWRAQQMSEAQYQGRFTEDEARYTQMLTVLIGALAPEKLLGPRRGTE
jgi:hypothetical protein